MHLCVVTSDELSRTTSCSLDARFKFSLNPRYEKVIPLLAPAIAGAGETVTVKLLKSAPYNSSKSNIDGISFMEAQPVGDDEKALWLVISVVLGLIKTLQL